jgi:two-component system sensor kinase FixL
MAVVTDNATHSMQWWAGLTLILLLAALCAVVLLALAALTLRASARRKTRRKGGADERLVSEKSKLEEAELLLRLGRDFAASSLLASSLPECLNRLAGLVLQIPGVDCSAVYLRDKKTGDFKMRVCLGLGDDFIRALQSYYDADKFVLADLQVGRTVHVTPEDVLPPLCETMRRTGLRSALIVPVACGSSVVAALHVGSRQLDAFSREVQTTLESLAVRLGGVLSRFDMIGKLRESEVLFRRVAEGVFDVICLLDEEGRFLFVNTRAEQVFGYSGAELVGRHFSEALPEEEFERTERRFRDRLEGGGEPATYEMTLLQKNGGRLPVEVSVKTTLWQGRRAFVYAIRDLAERRRLEAQVLQIEEWERLRIGQDLHDSVGQELVGLACMLKVLENLHAREKAEMKQLAARARAVCLSAHADLRRVVGGLLPLGADESLGAALERLAANLRERSGVACDVKNKLALEMMVPQRAAHLCCIAQEAAANAIRHGGARHIAIELAGRGEFGVLRIDDDGGGFDIEAVRSGMGLQIMRTRASALGGTLAVERREAGGTTVCCEFPL